MKFLEKIRSRKLSKVLATAVIGGSLLFGGNADVSAAGADSEAMMKFREAYLTTYTDTRSFDQMLTFFGGTVFKADITADSQVLSDASMRINGTMNWSYTSPQTKQTTNLSIPFYIAQNGNEDMRMYLRRNGRWNWVLLPGFPSALANALKTNDPQTMQANMAAVKDVEIFKDDATQRIMKIVIDGKYASDLLEKYNDKFSTDAIINDNLKKALTSNDVYITWTVDKRTNRTVTAVLELTDLVRSFARGMLDDSAKGKIVFDKEEMALLDSIGYYSEFHYSLTYNSGSKKTLDVPAAAANSSENDGVFNDLVDDMTAVVKK